MLLRTVGEDVDLVTVLASKGRIEADSAQLEQVIVNLVVNARHAMPGGGKLKIETEDVTVGAKSTLAIDDTKRGGYVRPSVTDYRYRNGPRHGRPHIRTFLYHERKRSGNRSGSRRGLRDRQAESRDHYGR